MPIEKEIERVRKAKKAIGMSSFSLNESLIRDLRRVLIEKGYDGALVYAEQTYLAADENAEMVRVLTICRSQWAQSQRGRPGGR